MRPKPRDTAIFFRFKPLPAKLVSRVKTVIQRQEKKGGHAENDIYRVLGRTKNIDPMQGTLDWIEPNPFDRMPVGYRVRKPKVSRNYPGTRLVIKVLH